jgi:hypothetical protein
MRAVLGWPIAVETDWGPLSVPLWSNWIAFAAFSPSYSGRALF